MKKFLAVLISSCLGLVASAQQQSPEMVKFLVNERETPLKFVAPYQGPYYRWEDVKAFCATRLEHLDR